MFSKLFIRLLRPISREFTKPHITNSVIKIVKRLTPPMLLWSGLVVDQGDSNTENNEINTHKKDKIIKVDENNNITDELYKINYTSVLVEDCLLNEKNINLLIKTLGDAIESTCEKYRKNIDQQIDIIHAGRGLNPLDPYWDSLVQFKEKADRIKAEFDKFSNVIKFVEQLSFNLSVCHAVLNDAKPNEKPCDEFAKLEKKLQTELQKNTEKEQLLKKVSSEYDCP